MGSFTFLNAEGNFGGEVDILLDGEGHEEPLVKVHLCANIGADLL